MRKRILLFLLICSVLFVLAACGKEQMPLSCWSPDSLNQSSTDHGVPAGQKDVLFLDDVIQMSDVDALRVLYGRDRDRLLSVWGDPDMEYRPGDDTFTYDEWMLLTTESLVYVDVWYTDMACVSDIAMRGTNGMVSCDITEMNNGVMWTAGMTHTFWNDLERDAFEDFCSNAQSSAIMDRLTSAGITRMTVRDLLNGPVGAFSEDGKRWSGDVFLCASDDYATLQYVVVTYDSDTHSIPVLVETYIACDENGSFYEYPLWDEARYYADGETFEWDDLDWFQTVNGSVSE